MNNRPPASGTLKIGIVAPGRQRALSAKAHAVVAADRDLR